jgi:outer membrane beta-barrel protein
VSSAAYAEDPIDKELDYFWGKKRDVEVIQKRIFLREGRHEFTLFGGAIPNDDFFTYYPLGLRYNWFFLEDWSVEVFGAYTFNAESELRSFLTTGNLNVFLVERLKGYAALDGQWTPFHGKFALLTSKLTHFDINISFGAGVMIVENSDDANEADPKIEVQPMGNLGAGMQFYVLDWLAVRLDYRHFFYKSNAYNGLSWPAEVTLGVAFFTKAPR